MKRDTEDHPKVFRLMKALDIPQPYAVGLLHMLWQFTAKFARPGDVGRYPDERIAEAVGWPGDPQRLVAALHECGWLDRHRRARYLIHDWSEHCERIRIRAPKPGSVAAAPQPEPEPDESEVPF